MAFLSEIVSITPPREVLRKTIPDFRELTKCFVGEVIGFISAGFGERSMKCDKIAVV